MTTTDNTAPQITSEQGNSDVLANAVESEAPIEATLSGGIDRRHDLDALRAIAMLLGIGLHGVMSFMPLPAGAWPVQDIHQSDGYVVFMSMIHGFRMPLFFVISGFFTAMLWRKRGLGKLVEHRTKRILLPLILGMFTIVPAVWVVSIAAAVSGEAKPAQVAESADVWTAAAENDVASLAVLLQEGADVNALDSKYGAPPLTIAAWHGHTDVMERLMEADADVEARSRDGNVALHGAVFFGQVDATRLLLKAGADPNQTNPRGETPLQSAYADWGTTAYIAGMVAVELDQQELESSREELITMLTPLTGEGNDEVEEASQGEQFVWGMLFGFPVFHHLWFLAFLCWFVLAFVVYAFVLDKLNWDPPRWLSASAVSYLWLVPLTFLAQSKMSMFGPDTSVGLLPMPHVLAYYAIFFFFGALYFDADDSEGRMGRAWKLTLPLSLFVVFPVAFGLMPGGFLANQVGDGLRQTLCVSLQAVYVWLMTFGLMGLFRSLFSSENKKLRYVSDSSYWLYLVHLPLIMAGQWLVRDWPIPSLLKLLLVCFVTTVLMLISYQYCVRYTPIGTLLNGKRSRVSAA